MLASSSRALFALSLLLLSACGDDTSSGGAGATGGGGTGASSSDGAGGSGASVADGGSGAQGGGTADGGGGEAPAPPTHHLGGIGPDDLTCTCLDGSAVKSCAAIDCMDETAVTTQCTTDCEDRGGFDFAGCSDDGAACNGTSKLLCFCEDASIIEFCQTIDCFEGNAQEEICEPACVTRGGFASLSCTANDFGCVGGPDLVTCTCEGGGTVTVCGDADCANDPSLGSVCASACLQAGSVTASECSDDHPACE